MNRFLAGALCGAIVGSALTFALTRPEADTDSEPSAQIAKIQLRTQGAAGAPQSSGNTTEPVAPAGQLPARTSDAKINAPMSSNESASRPNTPVQPAPATASNAPISNALSNGSSTAANPIPMTEEHRQMLTITGANGNTLQQLHTSLENETRDESWSYYMEQMLGLFFVQRAPNAGVEISSIVCRTTSCEIQAFSGAGWQPMGTLLAEARKESWWDFTGVQSHSTDASNNRERALIFLQRGQKSTAR